MNKIKIGITIGDINGIGPEVIIKALSNDYFLQNSVPVIYGSSKVMGYHKNIVGNPIFSFVSATSVEKLAENKINVLNCWQEGAHISLGKATEEGGRCAYIALDRAVQDLKSGKIDALVTGPVNKHAMKLAKFPHLGHTEFIAEQLSEPGGSLMMMVSEKLRVALVTTHCPLSEVPVLLSKDRISGAIKKLNQSLIQDFGLEKPTLAVLGLNPHAGDDSEIGLEEQEIIRPAIIEAKKSGMLVSGPYSADGFFGGGSYTKFDCVLAMYHDQGLIPFKTLTFGEGVNFTSGLSKIRTSPDHGTAYDIAGMNIANESSMRTAIYSAMDIFRTRKEYINLAKNKLVKLEKTEEVA